MGRKRKSSLSLSPNYLKVRHRCADTKYRSKLQCLFKVLKGELIDFTTKDQLLHLALNYIQMAEDAISDAAGSRDVLNIIREEFISFLPQEEEIWKHERDVENWWLEAQDLLHNKSESMTCLDIQSLTEAKPSVNADDKEVVIKDTEQSVESCNDNLLNAATSLTNDSSTSNQGGQDLSFNYVKQIYDAQTVDHNACQELESEANEGELFTKGDSNDCFYIDNKDCHQLSQNGKNFIPVSVQDKILFPSNIQGNKAIPVFEDDNLGLGSAICYVLE
ncbi:uncharacterized protein LOC129225740 [Uloborus diversus]|uniref:uncharacterized protein LOC129225740 n=1 Tax=Uloborus diversus TaxID=327109 RepID=UPI00240A0130|nr:uncharacterized protein LOC129225740 [Uloborus diversus]